MNSGKPYLRSLLYESIGGVSALLVATLDILEEDKKRKTIPEDVKGWLQKYSPIIESCSVKLSEIRHSSLIEEQLCQPMIVALEGLEIVMLDSNILSKKYSFEGKLDFLFSVLQIGLPKVHGHYKHMQEFIGKKGVE